MRCRGDVRVSCGLWPEGCCISSTTEHIINDQRYGQYRPISLHSTAVIQITEAELKKKKKGLHDLNANKTDED